MKRPRRERYNNRVIYMATCVVTSPFVLAAAAFRGAGRLRERLKSPGRRRAEDQRRQSRVRRSQRGLAGDHVQAPSKTA